MYLHSACIKYEMLNEEVLLRELAKGFSLQEREGQSPWLQEMGARRRIHVCSS